MRKFWESIYSPNYISGYNPFILKDMNKAIERMVSAINNRKKIVVYGIPNVDGLCAISSLILVLKYLNADIEYVVHDDSSTKSKISSKDSNDLTYIKEVLILLQASHDIANIDSICTNNDLVSKISKNSLTNTSGYISRLTTLKNSIK